MVELILRPVYAVIVQEAELYAESVGRLVTCIREHILKTIEGIAHLFHVNGLAEAVAQSIFARATLAGAGPRAGQLQCVFLFACRRARLIRQFLLVLRRVIYRQTLIDKLALEEPCLGLKPAVHSRRQASGGVHLLQFADALMAAIDLTLNVGNVISAGFEDVLLEGKILRSVDRHGNIGKKLEPSAVSYILRQIQATIPPPRQ